MINKRISWHEIKKKLFSYRDKTKVELIMEYYITIILLLYPLFLPRVQQWSSHNPKVFIYFSLTLISLIYCIFETGKSNGEPKFFFHKNEFIILFLIILLTILALINIFRKDIRYEVIIFDGCLLISYCLIKNFGKININSLNLLLISAVPLLLESTQYILTGTDFFLGVSNIFEHPEDIITYFLLVPCVASLLYCNEKRRKWRFFYFTLASWGSLLLVSQKNIPSIIMLGMFFVFIPIWELPTVTLVKRNIFLLTSFLFGISCITLLQYFTFTDLMPHYDLKNGSILALLTIIVLAFICQYWEKVPKDRDPDRVLMKRFQKWYRRAVAFVLFILTAVVLTGNRMEGITDRFGIKTLKVFAASLQSSISSAESFYQQLLENYGIVGCFLWSFLSVLFLEKIIKVWRNADVVRKQYLSLSVLFLVQTLFYRLQPVSTPAFVVLLALALSEKKENISIEETSDTQ